MDRDSVKKSQATSINKALYPKLNYLYRLRKRMEEVGFPHDDKLYLLVCKAYDAMYALHALGSAYNFSTNATAWNVGSAPPGTAQTMRAGVLARAERAA